MVTETTVANLPRDTTLLPRRPAYGIRMNQLIVLIN